MTLTRSNQRLATELAKQQATAAGRSAVFNTAELLENILLWLPPKDLLRAQQVRKIVKASIEASSNDQRALLLEPLDNDSVCWKEDDEPADELARLESGHCVSTGDDKKCLKPSINPLMERSMLVDLDAFVSILHVGFVLPVFDPNANKHPYLFNYDAPGIVRDDLGPRSAYELDSLHSRIASWRSMLFMQPPCTKVTFGCECHRSARNEGSERQEEAWFVARNPQGVTLQNIVDTCRQHWMSCPNCLLDWNIACWIFQGHSAKEITRLWRYDIGSTWGSYW